MDKRKNNDNLKFLGSELTMAVEIINKVEPTLEVLYYLMNHGEGNPLVLILLSAKKIDVGGIIESEKRDTDVFFEVGENTYVMVCQDTKVDGGYRLSERLINTLASNEATDIYCSELEICSTQYPIKYALLKLSKDFNESKREHKLEEITFSSLN